MSVVKCRVYAAVDLLKRGSQGPADQTYRRQGPWWVSVYIYIHIDVICSWIVVDVQKKCPCAQLASEDMYFGSGVNS